VALEQRLADGVLQLADAAAGRGQGQVRLAGGGAEAAMLHAVDHEADRDEVEAGEVVVGSAGAHERRW